MMCKCLYLKQRSKKGQLYYYCSKHREMVELSCFRGCLDKEYKQVKKMKTISKTNKVTKATSIPEKVKKEVWERDNNCCIFCGKYVDWYYANSHYIKRSHNGMGIPKNIMTNCSTCHTLLEESPKREQMLGRAKRHFMSLYEDWNEEDLIYHKFKVQKKS